MIISNLLIKLWMVFELSDNIAIYEDFFRAIKFSFSNKQTPGIDPFKVTVPNMVCIFNFV